MTTSNGSTEDDASPASGGTSSLSALSIESCVYRGEGNANVVVALPHEQKVIRFRKSLPGEVSPDGGKIRVQREVEFVRDVVSDFLGSYVQIPEIHRYDKRDVARLSEALRPLRPEKRRHKDIDGEYATISPDYTFLRSSKELDPSVFRNGATFCVEIKPKQGYLRKVERRFQKCPYCLTQYYKLKKKATARRSTYCPFDLFSGEEERMKVALAGLLQSPQNNLKIFKNGTVVYDQESSISDLEHVLSDWFRSSATQSEIETRIGEFCNLLTTTLLHSFPHRQTRTPNHLDEYYRIPSNEEIEPSAYVNSDVVAKTVELLMVAQEKCDFDGQDLPTDSVLERILAMQRLPYANTEYIYSVYSKCCSLLNDDMVYADVKMLYKTIGHRNNKNLNTVAQVQRAENGRCSRLSFMNCQKSSRKHDDSNGNENSKCTYKVFPDYNDLNVTKDNVLSGTVVLTEYKDKYSRTHISNSKISNESEKNDEKECTSSNVEGLLALQNYLLFCTARDCSILMAFQKLDPKAISCVPQEYVIKISEEIYFLANVGVSDLDPKSIQCVKKHMKRDMDVLNSVICTLEEEQTQKNRLSLTK